MVILYTQREKKKLKSRVFGIRNKLHFCQTHNVLRIFSMQRTKREAERTWSPANIQRIFLLLFDKYKSPSSVSIANRAKLDVDIRVIYAPWRRVAIYRRWPLEGHSRLEWWCHFEITRKDKTVVVPANIESNQQVTESISSDIISSVDTEYTKLPSKHQFLGTEINDVLRISNLKKFRTQNCTSEFR